MDKFGKLVHYVHHKLGGNYTPISTLDPNEFLSDRLGHHKTPRIVTECAHRNTINTMAVFRAGMLFSGGKDGLVVLTNTDNGDVHQTWQSRTEINKMCYRNYVAKHSLVTGGRDGTLSLWVFALNQTCEPAAVFDGHQFGVTGLVNLCDTQFMSGSRDCTVKLWDVERSTPVLSETINRNLCTHMSHDANTKMVAQSSEDKSVRIWDPRNLEVAIEFPRKRHIQMYCEFGGDNRLFSCSNGFNGDGCEITSYDVRNPRAVREGRGHEGNVTSLAILHFDAPSRRLLVSVSADKRIRIWRTEEEGVNVLKPLWDEEVPLEADNLQVATYPEGHIIVSGGKGRLIHYHARFVAQRIILDVLLLQKCRKIAQSASAHVLR
ncbi:unnamed protein product [Caenorhabditis sp. 36 PRJEB53466]|nr:unnamed protein product [Caenorhabditis sp. 36 PRJEB53466]